MTSHFSYDWRIRNQNSESIINSKSKCQEINDEAVKTKEISHNKNYNKELGSIRHSKNSNVSNLRQSHRVKVKRNN